MWSPVGPHVQWDLSNVFTYGTSCTVGPFYCDHLYDLIVQFDLTSGYMHHQD